MIGNAEKISERDPTPRPRTTSCVYEIEVCVLSCLRVRVRVRVRVHHLLRDAFVRAGLGALDRSRDDIITSALVLRQRVDRTRALGGRFRRRVDGARVLNL